MHLQVLNHGSAQSSESSQSQQQLHNGFCVQEEPTTGAHSQDEANLPFLVMGCG